METNKISDRKKAQTQDWKKIQEQTSSLLQKLTIQQSLQQYLELHRAFEWQMKQTEHLFQENRQRTLIEIQSRLQHHATWHSKHGKPVPFNPTDPTTTP